MLLSFLLLLCTKSSFIIFILRFFGFFFVFYVSNYHISAVRRLCDSHKIMNKNLFVCFFSVQLFSFNQLILTVSAKAAKFLILQPEDVLQPVDFMEIWESSQSTNQDCQQREERRGQVRKGEDKWGKERMWGEGRRGDKKRSNIWAYSFGKQSI